MLMSLVKREITREEVKATKSKWNLSLVQALAVHPTIKSQRGFPKRIAKLAQQTETSLLSDPKLIISTSEVIPFHLSTIPFDKEKIN